MNAQSTILNFSLRPRSLTRSHVAALSPEPLRVDPGDEVEGVHVAVHAHRDAFLETLLCDSDKYGVCVKSSVKAWTTNLIR